MDYYKGYLITENKKSHEKRSGRKTFLSLEEVQSYSEYAGVLADGIVLVDFDDSEKANAAIQIIKDFDIPCRAIKTSRGVHMLFKSSDKLPEKTHCNIACGLDADFKTGFNNSYEVLKFEGVEREIIIDTGVSDLPFFFYQVPQSEINLWKMKEGDGRNSALFEYEIHCLRKGLSKEQIRNLYHIINNYIFKDCLSESELENITRDSAFEKILHDGKKPNTRLIADLIITNDHVIQIGKRLAIYQKTGEYSFDVDKIEKKALSYVATLTIHQRKEILA